MMTFRSDMDALSPWVWWEYGPHTDAAFSVPTRNYFSIDNQRHTVRYRPADLLFRIEFKTDLRFIELSNLRAQLVRTGSAHKTPSVETVRSLALAAAFIFWCDSEACEQGKDPMPGGRPSPPLPLPFKNPIVDQLHLTGFFE